MKLWPLIALLVLQDSPVRPLVEVAKKLDAGAEEFLKGTAPAEAWKPWPVSRGVSETDVRKALSDAGAKKLSSLGLEFEIYFFKAGKAVGHLKSFVYVDGTETSFMEFEFSADAGVMDESARPLDEWAKFQPEFAAAAKNLLAEVKAKQEKAIRFPDVPKLTKRCVFEGLVDSAKKQIEDCQAKVKETCEKLAALDYTEARLRLDDCPMLVLADGDTPVAVLNLQLSSSEDKLSLALGRFKPFKKK